MNTRLQRINKLIKEEVGKIILREEDFGRDILVTITNVETSKDLRYTKILVSVFPFVNAKRVIAQLEGHIFDLQQILNKRLNMRPVPKIRFEIDESEERIGRIDRLLQKVNIRLPLGR